MLTFFFAAFLGVAIGVTGVLRGWTMTRTMIVSLAVGVAISIFTAITDARADEAAAFARLRQTTVMVNGARCSGSGSIVKAASGKLVLLTNSHVCNCARYRGDIFATYEGGEVLQAKIVKQDWSVDLCAAEVKNRHHSLYVGPRLLPLNRVYTRGYSLGRLSESSGRVVGGVRWVTSFRIEEVGECPKGSQPVLGNNDILVGCLIEYVSTLSNLYARPGASGSPVVNDSGELVGVVSSWHTDSDYDAGLVPFGAVRDFVDSL